MSTDIACVVALGASNLTRGFQTVVSSARSAWGGDVEVLAALGHGRSYGAPSRFLFRTLPGIIKSGLWAELERRPPTATRGLVTDVGNDILYGFSIERTLGWVEEVLVRLRRVTNDIVLTDLPLASIHRLSHLKFLAFRSALVPSCRLSLSQVIDRAERVNEGIRCARHEIGSARSCLVWFRSNPCTPVALASGLATDPRRPPSGKV